MDAAFSKRHVISISVLTVCLLLIVRLFFLERFHIPTGSMAPALLGRHRCTECPRCEYSVRVGRGGGLKTVCPNCGQGPISLAGVPFTGGDHIVVDKHSIRFRRPRRWSLVLFRLFGRFFIKRLVGLPCERIDVKDGEIYADGVLCRKSLDEAQRMRVLVFDNDYQPKPDGWRKRWEYRTNTHSAAGLLPRDCRILRLHNATHSNQPVWLSYRHFDLDESKCRPICDEYAYNGSRPTTLTPVHDFHLSCEVEPNEGDGWLMLAINDGGDQVVVRIPVGRPNSRSAGKSLLQPFPEQRRFRTLTTPYGASLQRNRRYRLTLAFVDRRLTCQVNSEDVFEPVDFPVARHRSPVIRPFVIGACNIDITVRHVRLFRDVHYTSDGRNTNSVALDRDDYFVLGDNSPNSDDSRFWPNNGAISAEAFVGRPILLHFPHRWTRWTFLGRAWQMPDWSRFGWLQ